ncbi:MAG: glycosyltransferase family 39 protein [Candidatus Aenigmatarchaeota archaeon]
MKKNNHKKTAMKILPAITLFLFALLVRLYLFQGFVLGDDAQEFHAAKYILYNGPDLNDPLHVRFGVWIFNVLSFRLFGISEFSFFLPTLIISSTFGVIGYSLLCIWKYPKKHAFLAGLFIASAPFEILIGTLRANDLIFSWFLALALFSFFVFSKKPVIQGVLIGLFLWLAFYVKLWAVYLFPFFGIYYLNQIIKYNKRQGFASFSLSTIFFHSITSIIWKIKLGTLFPFLYKYSATYPVPSEQIPFLFQIYPKMILFGSEFGTTLFGIIPYLLFMLLAVKLILSRKNLIKFDKIDIFLLAYYGSFFVLINFFPDTFKFDQYYSVPRIFRYLTPLSFPMLLHIAKTILDFSKINLKTLMVKKYLFVIIFALLILANIYQAGEATRPGRLYRETLFSIINDIENYSPPALLTEFWLGFFMRELYLKDRGINVVPIYNINDARDYEIWLKENQYHLLEGTMLITGLGSYTHYGCHSCGFRLRLFRNSLDANWKLFKDYGVLSYLSSQEHVRLWYWSQRGEN